MINPRMSAASRRHFMYLLVAILCVVALRPCSAEEQRLLETPERWMQVGGGDKSFAFSDGQLSLRRHDNEPSLILTRADYENMKKG